MAKLKISDYSSTSAGANLNTDINSINIDEGCAPSGINNAIRTLMAQLKDFQTGVSGDNLTLGGDLNVDTNTLYVDSTNNNVGIGTSSPTYKLQIQEGVYTLLAGADSTGSSLTDATQKTMRYGLPHYTNAEEPVAVLYASSSSGNNALNIGGGTNLLNALTRISFYTAANETTVTGTERMRIDENGNVGIGTSSPTYALSIGDANGMYSDGDGLHIVQNTSQLDTLALKSQGTITYNTNYDDGTTNAHHIFKVSSTTEAMRIDSNGDVGIGTASPSTYGGRLNVTDGTTGGETTLVVSNNNINQFIRIGVNADVAQIAYDQADTLAFGVANESDTAGLTTEHMRITSGGSVGISCTTDQAGESTGTGGLFYNNGSWLSVTASSAILGIFNRMTSDGNIILFRQAGTTEGSIAVSGTTVSYNGGHLSRFAQLPNSTKDETILKGTVLSNLDDMCVYVNSETGETVDNEQLNKVKVSDVEGDPNVAGVHVSWIYDEQHDVEEINMAMTGDMIIRIAQGVTVNRGDLLMSAGDGTAKPQGDDIVRSKTIAKVTSTSVTCTYDDGSYCVPCVLMAC